MKVGIFAFTRQGCALARRVGEAIPEPGEISYYTMERFREPGFLAIQSPLTEFVGPLFSRKDVLIFVGACAVAVRAVAPWVRNKKEDPAVLVLDQEGRFVISLLSGHIGGANDLARTLGETLGATPVVTTATDVAGRFAVDEWANRQNLVISDMGDAKAVSAAILEGDIPLCSDFPICGSLPRGLTPGQAGPLGIYIGWERKHPFDRTLQLIPRLLHLGIGCRRGIPRETIEEAVNRVLAENGIRREAIRDVSSIDLKSEEPGLLAFCEDWGLTACFYSPGELEAVPGSFPASSFVASVTGVDNVCQRAAMKKSKTLLVPKTAREGVTVSLGAEDWEVVF